MRGADFTNHRYRTRISKRQFRRILRLFAPDLKAVQIAALTRLSRVSINRHLTALRQRMARLCEQAAPMSGEIEVDESYFGARRAKGKHGRGEWARDEAHINGIEGFWDYAKSRLSKFRGMNKRILSALERVQISVQSPA